MKNILIIGANGSLARVIITATERHPAFNLTLFARSIPRMQASTASSSATRSILPICKMPCRGRTLCTSIWQAIWQQWA